MNKIEVVETLRNLQAYVEDEWDIDNPEIKKESEECSNAIDFVLKMLADSNVVGNLIIEDKCYLITETNRIKSDRKECLK